MCVCLCQQNVSLLEAEEKTMDQLAIEDGSQILIEGHYYAATATQTTTFSFFCLTTNYSSVRLHPQK